MGFISSSIWEITYLDMTLRILLALLLGGLIGLEREINNHAAGFRTHILVCVGSATIMLLSIYGFSDFVNETSVRMDPARLAAQVITGIGFLGAGAIIRTGSYVSGLTTAASIWIVSAIGLCVGAGFYFGAVLVSFLVLVSLFVFNKWEKYMLGKYKKHELSMEIYDRQDILGKIVEVLGEQGIQIHKLRVQSNKKEELPQTVWVQISIKMSPAGKIMKAVSAISALDEVLSIEVPTFSNLTKVPMSPEQSVKG
ncbi:MgtC/SapB family protein [Paenibacillus donghaensis]|uniref:Magnesium transporter MgtC n=1 Tax=Paenibacillus donghaensis TaxID=414771 RepID=A0A2Z2KUS6_9BACL|nr:MgtC/SapB family protein [Paenibacillus donghaensis]ASA25892.1 magnesium transporter MgtC [Paenibacillus donghaensis]